MIALFSRSFWRESRHDADMSAHPTARWRARERRQKIAAAILGVVATLFAALNVDEVQVNWILGTWETPLIVVIVLSFLLGVATDRLLAARRAKAVSAGDG